MYSKEVDKIKSTKGALEGTIKSPMVNEDGRLGMTLSPMDKIARGHELEEELEEAPDRATPDKNDRDGERRDQSQAGAMPTHWDIDPKKPASGEEKWLKEMILQPIEGSQANFFHIKETGGKIGRHSHNQVVILDESVSRNHAEILFKNNEFFLKDIGSTTGTYIKIVNRLQLKVDMIIEIGSYQFIVSEIKIALKGIANDNEKSYIKLEVLDCPESNDSRERNTYLIYDAGTIGRKPNNLMKFQEDLHMSNIHCKISLVSNSYFLEDLSSTNG